MKSLMRMPTLLMLLLSALLLGACGSKPVTLADLPVYPGATELKPGESTIADTLKNNGQQDAAVRQAAGVGGSTTQKGFDLPADATWDQVKAFYTDKLKASGWTEGLGGPAGTVANQALSQVNQASSAFQTNMYSKDKQTLTVMRLTLPSDATKVQLILSLSTQ